MNQPVNPVVPTEYGLYRKVSARLPEFLKTYPPQEGFGIEIEVVDPLSLRPGLHALYLECIRSGRTHRNLPASDDPSWNAIVFNAYLTKDGVRLHSASTLQNIQFEKDYESAETRVRGRLLSALGFGPEALDYDELNSRPADNQTVAPTEPNGEMDVDDDVDEENDVVPAPMPTAPSTPEDDGSQDAAPTLTPQLQAQVDARCIQLDATGITYQRPDNQRDALTFLRETKPGVQSA